MDHNISGSLSKCLLFISFAAFLKKQFHTKMYAHTLEIKTHPCSLTSSTLPLQGCCAAGQELADCAARGQGSDPDGHEFLWGPDCGCDHGPHSGYCHSQSGARSVARAGVQASHVDGWCRRGSPWKALRGERNTIRPSAYLIEWAETHVKVTWVCLKLVALIWQQALIPVNLHCTRIHAGKFTNEIIKPY